MSVANKKTPREFQCRNRLWGKFEEMAGELECSVDYLINDAMKQYARQRGYTKDLSRASVPPSAAVSPTTGAVPPPTPMAAPATATPGGRVSTNPLASLGPATAGPPPIPASPLGASPPVGGPPLNTPGGVSTAPPMPPPARGGSGAHTVPLSPSKLPPMPTAGARRAPPPPSMSRAPAPPSPPGFGQMVPGAAMPPPPGAMQQAAPQALTIHYQGRPYQVTKERFIIGRGKTSSDLTIRDPNVSRQHALVEFSGGHFYMVDMGSTNGVEFKGQRVQRKTIQNGDVYRVCDHELFCSMN